MLPPPFAAAARARLHSSDTRGPSPPSSRRRTCTRTSRSPPRRRAPASRRSARTCSSSRAPSALPVPEIEHGQERLLRHLDPADLLHTLLALLLLLEQLALARDVAAVALREHVLALGLHRLAGDHPRTDRRLDRDVEHLPRDLLPQPLDELLAPFVRRIAVDDQRERVDLLAADEDVDAGQRPLAETDQVVIEARVAAGSRLELVVEVDHDLRERQLVREQHALLRQILH